MDVWIYINGIRHRSGDLESWPDRFTHLTHFTTHARAYPAEHHFFVIRNYRKLQKISELIARVIEEYCQRGYRVHLCTHSNGAVIGCRALRYLTPHTPIATFHAIAPAAWGDFARNGLNFALRYGALGQFFFYGSIHDRVVQLGRYTGWLLRPIGAGYGGLAYTGPRNVDPAIKDRVHPFWASSPNPEWVKEWGAGFESKANLYFGHSTWFTPDFYRQTFARVQHNTAVVIPDYAASLQHICQTRAICQQGRAYCTLFNN